MKKLILILSIVSFFPLISLASFDKNLYYGLQSDQQVKELQEFLTDQGVYSGPITGNFFSLTLAAVKKYQSQNGIIPAAGFFGPLTRIKANEILSANIESSNQQAVSETGSTTPPAEPAKTTNDVVKTLQDQINALLAQLQQINAQVQTQTTLQQQTQSTLQQTQQSVQQIQQNTAPVPPAPVVVPEVKKELIVTADKTSVQLNGWDYSGITAVYTEDGLPKSTNITFTTPNETKINKVIVSPSCGNSLECGKTAFSYHPTELGTYTISVAANGITKTIDISVVPYVKVDAKFSGENYNTVLLANQTRQGIGLIKLIQPADETISVERIGLTNSGSLKSGWFYSSNGGDGTYVFDGNKNATSTLSSQPKFSSGGEFIVYVDTISVPSGNYILTITGMRAIGQNSGTYRNVQGLPITFTFTVQ